MKTKLIALAAAIGLAIVALSLAVAKPTDQGKIALVKKHKVVKHKLVKHKKLKLHARLNCEKPVVVKGVKQCPPAKGAVPK
ncbi:MAG: hypothetical protein U1F37_16675 [Alphaproteobacteria bacterium]